MRRVSLIVAGLLAIGTATAQAQTPKASETGAYATFTGGFTAGHVVGGVVGADLGWRLNLSWDAFFEGDYMMNTKTADMDAAADIVSKYLASVSGQTATSDVKQPVTHFAAGVRYKLPTTGRIQPYVAVGGGAAKVERKSAFFVNGTDVTGQLPAPPYSVQLGGDLVGDETGGLVTFGVGAQVGRDTLFLDVSYRYARVFLSEAGLNTNRVLFGIGARF